MKYLSFIRHSEKHREAGPPPALMDGPFTETKEVIGGWAILKAGSKEEALRIATDFLDLHRKHWPEFEGECEVRPMFELEGAVSCA